MCSLQIYLNTATTKNDFYVFKFFLKYLIAIQLLAMNVQRLQFNKLGKTLKLFKVHILFNDVIITLLTWHSNT